MIFSERYRRFALRYVLGVRSVVSCSGVRLESAKSCLVMTCVKGLSVHSQTDSEPPRRQFYWLISRERTDIPYITDNNVHIRRSSLNLHNIVQLLNRSPKNSRTCNVEVFCGQWFWSFGWMKSNGQIFNGLFMQLISLNTTTLLKHSTRLAPLPYQSVTYIEIYFSIERNPGI